MLKYNTMTTRARASKPTALDEHTAAHVAEMFGVFGDPNRVRIISVLVEGEQNVGTLAESVDLSVSAVSHHMRGLRQMRLVQARKEGRQVFYCLDDHIAHLFRYGLEHVRHG
jgi:DNA-binding transcriptional ArsR family regulator